MALLSCTLTVVSATGNRVWAGSLTSSAGEVPGNELAQVFQPPDKQAPEDTSGGASRGNGIFAPPEDSAPTDTSGGASRGDGDGEFIVPVNVGAPRGRVGGGTRGPLSTLIALMPPTNYGQTVSRRPTFFVYVPSEALKETKEVFFSLQDSTQDYHYQTRIELPTHEGGIISFQLPEDAPELAVGQAYKWYFILTEKGQRLEADSQGVTGWVERIEPSGELELHQSSQANVEVALSYARAGMWYDTVQTLVQLKQGLLQDTTSANYWETLLREVGLEEIASQPIVELPQASDARASNTSEN